MRILFFLVTVALALHLSACGSSTDDNTIVSLTISPATATASHSAAAPANTQFFAAFAGYQGGNHPASSLGSGVTWATSDTVNTSITGTGTATVTCLAATPSAVTITATVAIKTGSTQTVSGTASMSCT